MPKVSIVLPTYNGQKYIRESIESVINQTFQDWELIIVNDCSTDSTPVIVEEFADLDARIKVIHNDTNKKLPASLNIGFDSAKGEYYTWTSDDNYYLPQAIEEMVNYLDNHGDEQMVVADMDIIDANNQFITSCEQYNDTKMYVNDCVGACFMYRKQVLNTIGIYDENMFLVEDYEYWLRILFYYGTIGHINKTLYIYRAHAGNLTSTRKHEIRRQLLRLRWEYIYKIVEKMKDSPDVLCMLYYEFLEAGYRECDLREIFLKYIPFLNNDVKFKKEKKIIVYGAGKVGDLAYSQNKDLIMFYADKDVKKIGNTKNGIPIISIEDMISKKEKYQIMIGVGTDKIYEVVELLQSVGVDQYCTVYS